MHSTDAQPSLRTDGSVPSIIDLRSDTVTRPTDAMYQRMRTAPLGDDGQDGDPTVRELEEVTARTLGKAAGLFVPSCTMANLLAVFIQVQRGEQIIVEAESHMYVAEPGATIFSGGLYVPIAGRSGEMNLEQLANTLEGGAHRAPTGMVALETSHNNAGGAVLPVAHLAAVSKLARERSVPVHIDGARLFNAAVYLGVKPAELAVYADTVSICLSKGLSAPVGAVLVGETSLIDKARVMRRMLGGQQRQAGVVAAAGLVAVSEMGERLHEDHARARRLSILLNQVHPGIAASDPQTNIVLLDISRGGATAGEWSRALAEHGLLARPWHSGRIRMITHRHILDADVERAAAIVGVVAERLIKA